MTKLDSEMTDAELIAKYTWLTEVNPQVEYQKRLDNVLYGMVQEKLISEEIREKTFDQNKYLAKIEAR